MAELYRPHNIETLAPKRLIVVGNGAVVGGWAPMLKAIRRSPMAAGYDTLDDEELALIADLIPSQTVHQYNMIRATVIKSLEKLIQKDQVLHALYYFQDFFEFIACIGDEYDTTLEFRPEIDLIKGLVDDLCGVMTLNYENSLWEFEDRGTLVFPNIIHLHGRASAPESLYFPTDNTVQDEIFDLLNLIDDKQLFETARKVIRDRLSDVLGEGIDGLRRRYNDISQELSVSHSSAIRWLEQAKEIVVWGVGLNSYDAEFLTIMNTIPRAFPANRTLTVINPSEKIGEKTRLYLGVSKENYNFVKPKGP